MHSKGSYEICICLVILGKVNFFKNYVQELIITSSNILDVI